jgi:hypothetical protein
MSASEALASCGIFELGGLSPGSRSFTGLGGEPCCQRKVEMSYSLQSRNVRFSLGGARGRDSLGVPVKRRRAMLASIPIKE